METLGLLLLALGPAAAASSQDSRPTSPAALPEIRIGDAVAAELRADDPPLASHGPSRHFLFRADVAGSVTISLESYDFDAFLRVEAETSALVAEDDNGGVETNARVVLEAKADAGYRIVAAAAKEGGGEFALSIASGDVARPAGAALLDAGIAFRARAAERALARGDKKAAAAHRLLEGLRRYSRSQFAEAKSAYESALALSKELGDRAGEAAALIDLGNVFRSLGKFPEALDHCERGLAVAREARHRQWEANALGNLGNVYQALADYPKALEHHEQRLALAQDLGDRAGEAAALINLGNVFRSLGDYPKARDHYEEGLAVARKVGHRQWEANAIGNLGLVYKDLGDYPKALEHLGTRLARAREVGDRAGAAGALGNLGLVYHDLGDYPKARGHVAEYLAIAREVGDRAGQARALGNLGAIWHRLGDYPKAREHHEQHLAVVRDLRDRAGQARALGNLGDIHRHLGDTTKARELLEEQLALSRDLRDRVGEAAALGNLGVVCRYRGDLPKAREHFEKVLVLFRDLRDRAGEATALGNLGDIDLRLGDFPKARESAEASLALLEPMGVGEGGLSPLLTLARVALAERDSARALASQGEARRILERPSLRDLETDESAGHRSRFSGWEEVGQDLAALRVEEAGSDAARRSRAAAEGFMDAGQWKGRALLEGVAEHRVGGRTAEAMALRREWRETLARRDVILQRVSESIRKGKEPKAIEDLRNEAHEQEARAQDLAVRLRELSPRDAALDLPLGATPEAVRSVLGKGAALVEFAEGKAGLYAYALSEKGLSFHVLGKRKEIGELLQSYLSNFSDPSLLGGVGLIADEGRRLFDKLLAPALAAAGEGIERLVLVPTASLATLPFEALVVGSKGPGEPRSFGDLEFLLDRYDVAYSPSSPLLIELHDLGPRREQGQVLLLADPRYPSEPVEVAAAPQAIQILGVARSVPEPGQFRRLGKTRAEALAIAGLLAKREKDEVATSLAKVAERRSASLDGDFFDLHLGAAASRARLAGDLKPFSILHVAAHGYVDPKFPQRTGVALAFGEGEDGYFSIADALELDLDANLVVLSACETARGEVRGGEGVESLARAFMYAGARAVVASLWQVEDRAAAETMEAFYRGVLKGGETSPARALREAKLAVRRSKESRGVSGVKPAEGASSIESGHPYFWAPFIYMGLPR